MPARPDDHRPQHEADSEPELTSPEPAESDSVPGPTTAGEEEENARQVSPDPEPDEVAVPAESTASDSAASSWRDRMIQAGAVLALPVAILTLAVGVLDLPEKPWWPKLGSSEKEEIVLRVLTGEVRDAETNSPLPGVDVVLLKYGKRQITNELGRYRFELEVPQYTRVNLRATLDGYKPIEEDPMVGGNDTWIMRRSK